MRDIRPRAARAQAQQVVGAQARRLTLPLMLLACTLAFALAACHSLSPVDTAPLDHAGMNYDAIQQAKTLHVTAPEVAGLARARQSGISDTTCVTLLQLSRGRGQAFDEGDTVAGLAQAGMSEQTIIELAKLNQLGLIAGELQAMSLAGFHDDIILEVARHRSAGQPVLAGASLANLKNVGLREATLLELTRRGVPDVQAGAIASFRRRGATDADILRQFTGS